MHFSPRYSATESFSFVWYSDVTLHCTQCLPAPVDTEQLSILLGEGSSEEWLYQSLIEETQIILRNL